MTLVILGLKYVYCLRSCFFLRAQAPKKRQDSTARQWKCAAAALAKAGVSCKKISKVKEVMSGTVPLQKRGKLLALLDHATDIYVESARALSRKTSIGEEIFDLAAKKKVNITCADMPTLFKPDPSPIENFMRKVVLAMQELERDVVTERLMSGLRAKKQQTCRQTQTGTPKANGRFTRLEILKPKVQIIKKLKQMAKQREKGKFGCRALGKAFTKALKLKKTLSVQSTRRMAQEISVKF